MAHLLATISVQQVGFLLRVHRRSEWLPVIFSQMREVARGRRAHLVVMADRPSPSVVAALAQMERKMPDSFTYTLLECPEPIKSAQGCRWTETMQYMYQKLRKDGASGAGMLWDDDIVFSDVAIQELRAHLSFFEFDRVEAEWLNISTPDATQYDRGFTCHRGTHLFRIYADDDWSDILTRTTGGGGTQSPIFVARSHSKSDMKGRVLHMGYCTADEREHAWNAAKACGQADAYFIQLHRKPKHTLCRGATETSRTLARHLTSAAAQ
ncbi:MAG: hypothetical protein V3S01_04650 [Dehalococcoidia bacterium]